MSTKTTNYEFVKPALSDAPPDITATNGNWDLVDEKLKTAEDHAASTQPVSKGGTGATTASQARTNLGAVSKSGDTMTGDLTLDNKTLNLTTKSGTSVKGTFELYGSNETVSGSLQTKYTRSKGHIKYTASDSKTYEIEMGNYVQSSNDPIEEYFDYTTPQGTSSIFNGTIGHYTGSATSSREIELPFKPRAVLLMTNTGITYESRSGTVYGGWLLQSRDDPYGYYPSLSVGGTEVAKVTGVMSGDTRKYYLKLTHGSTITDPYADRTVNVYPNKPSETYVYIAFR